MTTKELFAEIERRLRENPAKLSGLTATYRFNLSGDDGGTWTVKVENGAATVTEGESDPAGCTIHMAAADLQAMAGGQLNPVTAFMSGKLRVQGDMSLAMRLQSILG